MRQSGHGSARRPNFVNRSVLLDIRLFGDVHVCEYYDIKCLTDLNHNEQPESFTLFSRKWRECP